MHGHQALNTGAEAPIDIRDIAPREIPALAGFAPTEWRVALDQVILAHFGRAYLEVRIALAAGEVLAIAQGIVTGESGWLGNIIVRPEARGRGIGTRMTQDMVARLRARGCQRLLLVATAQGEPLYRKLGFEKTSEYVFLEMARMPVPPPSSVRRLALADVAEVLELDSGATGEQRAGLLTAHVAGGWAHVGGDGMLDGFFLPTLGAGMVIAREPAAGCALLEIKHALYDLGAVVPAENRAALTFLLARGAREVLRVPRMALGGEVAWRPGWTFARGTGYCG